jgi:uncharacterized membrane protein
MTETWIFLSLMNILIPIIMIIFGKIFITHPPKNINGLYGYRTKRSMKNKETWDFAHKYLGAIWYKYGFIVLFISLVLMLLLINLTDDEIAIYALIINLLQLIPLIYPVFVTEKALKDEFDQ